MLIFEVKKEKTDSIMTLFKECGNDVGVIETHRFSGTAELIQIAVMVTAATIGGIKLLVKDIKSGSVDATVRGDGEEMNPEDITEEYLEDHFDDI